MFLSVFLYLFTSLFCVKSTTVTVVKWINTIRLKKKKTKQDSCMEDLQTQCFPETLHCSTSIMWTN